MDLNIEEFINEISPQENTLEDIQLVSGSSDPDTFPEDSFGLNEVPHIECSYPELGNEVNMGLSQTPTFSPEYPVGFENLRPLPDIFNSSSKTAQTKLHLTNPERGVMQDKTGLNLSEIADAILDLGEFMRVKKQLAFYGPQNWNFIDQQKAISVFKELLEKVDRNVARSLRSSHYREIYEILQGSTKLPHLKAVPLPDYRVLCCEDGLYCWLDSSIYPHNSSDIRFSHLNISAREIFPQDTPYFDAFLNNIAPVGDPIQDLILEIFGVIITGYPVKKLFYFYGVPDSGKSQSANILKWILGEDSSFTITDVNAIGNDRVTGALPGKLLLVCPDVPDVPLNAKTVAGIKQLTGDDTMFGRPLYKDPINFENAAKLLLISNFPLQLYKGVSDTAFWDRIIKVPFRNSVPEERQIKKLHEKLQGEVGGIVWKALEALRTFKANGSIFTEIDAEIDSGIIFQPNIPTDRDRILDFVHEKCIIDPNAVITVDKLFTEFVPFDRRRNPILKPILDSIFSRTLNQSGLEIKKYRTDSERGYYGICLKQDCPEDPENMNPLS